MTIILKALTSIGLSLISEKAIKEFLLWILQKGADSSKATWDNELVDLVKKHMGKS